MHRGHANARTRHQDVHWRHPQDPPASRPGITRSSFSYITQSLFGSLWKCTFVNIFTSSSSWAAQMPLCVRCSWKFCSRANQKEFSCLWTRWVFLIEATLLLSTKIKHCFLALKFFSLLIFFAHKKKFQYSWKIVRPLPFLFVSLSTRKQISKFGSRVVLSWRGFSLRWTSSRTCVYGTSRAGSAHIYMENTILHLFVFMFRQTSLTADSVQMKVIICIQSTL